MIEGVFVAGEDGQVHFTEAAALTPEDRTAAQQQVRVRVLRWFARAGPLDSADAQDMAGWHHGGGFSLDASVRIDGQNVPGWNGCYAIARARRSRWSASSSSPTTSSSIVSPGLEPDGRTELRLTPLELIERLAALIPHPRLHLHRHRYHGTLAPVHVCNGSFRARRLAWSMTESGRLETFGA